MAAVRPPGNSDDTAPPPVLLGPTNSRVIDLPSESPLLSPHRDDRLEEAPSPGHAPPDLSVSLSVSDTARN